MSELAKCPFCGSDAAQDDEFGDDAVVCQNPAGVSEKGCLMVQYPMPAEKWNRRAALSGVRVISSGDSFCPKCGHNRDTSSVSSINLEQDQQHQCQMCGCQWREIE